MSRGTRFLTVGLFPGRGINLKSFLFFFLIFILAAFAVIGAETSASAAVVAVPLPAAEAPSQGGASLAPAAPSEAVAGQSASAAESTATAADLPLEGEAADTAEVNQYFEQMLDTARVTQNPVGSRLRRLPRYGMSFFKQRLPLMPRSTGCRSPRATSLGRTTSWL